MPRQSSAALVRYATLAKSGHGFVVTVPAVIRAALGWSHGEAVELWIEGETLMMHRAVRARDVPRPDGHREGR